MRIIEKKCPNCGANLEYKVGEHDVKCDKCRRAFAVEYDEKIVDPEIELRAKDLTLKMMDDFEASRKFSKVFIKVVIGFMILFFAFFIVMFITQFIDMKKDEAEFEKEYNETKNLIQNQINN